MINYAEVIEKLSMPVLVVHKSGVVQLANKQALLSLPSVQLGADIKTSFQKGSDLTTLFRKVTKSGSDHSLNLVTTGSKKREYRVTATTLGKKPGRMASLLLTLEDLTSVRLAKSMRSDFVANVSHEIRSPLTSISGFVESLQDADDIDDETRALFLGLMAKEVIRMTNLVSDLLSLSKVEAKERKVLKKRVNIQQVAQQACESVAALAAEGGKRVETRFQNAQADVLGKQDDLLRVFINLLENALNYSRKNGTVTLGVVVVGKDNPLGCEAICASVSDEGDGIPADEIPRLTERFYRVDKSRSRNVGGTGLGLSIVKHILVRHRGKLLIESTPGKGSTFSIYIPILLS